MAEAVTISDPNNKKIKNLKLHSKKMLKGKIQIQYVGAFLHRNISSVNP